MPRSATPAATSCSVPARVTPARAAARRAAVHKIPELLTYSLGGSRALARGLGDLRSSGKCRPTADRHPSTCTSSAVPSASSLARSEWPGWCRSAKTGELALEALRSYAPRYAVVAAEAGIEFDAASAGKHLEVRESLVGTTTTDFGAPAVVAAADREPLTREQAVRLSTLLRAAWSILDRVVAAAPAELRKGPRGGGRDRDAVAAHVVAAEYAYARKLGLRDFRQPTASDTEGVAGMRTAIAKSLSRVSKGSLPENASWPPRYAARRLTWHVLDHAWEIEDRSMPAR